MRGRSMLWLAPLSLATAPACSSTSTVSTHSAPVSRSTAAVRVTPAVGGPRTRFTVTFRAGPGKSPRPSLARRYVITAAGPRGRGCGSASSAGVSGLRLNSLAHVELTPTAPAGWCAGTYDGRVGLVLSPVCSPGHECPMFLVNGGTIGRFSFRVK